MKATALTTRQIPDWCALAFRTEAEALCQLGSGHLLLPHRDVGGHIFHRINDPARGIQVIQFLAQPPNLGGQALNPLASCQRVVPRQRTQQRRLAGTIHTDETDALTRRQTPRQVIHERAPIRRVDTRVLQLNDHAALALLGKRHELHRVTRCRNIRDQGLCRLNAVARLRRACRRTATQPRQLLARQILAALLNRIRLARTLRTCKRPVVVATLVHIHLAVVNFPRQRGHCVQEPAVVRNHDESELPLHQMVRQPLHAFNVQVVRRLVQNDQIQVPHECGSEVHPAALTTRELPHRCIQTQVSHASTREHLTHLRIGSPLIDLQAEGLHHGLPHRHVLRQIKALRYHRHAQVIGVRDTPLIRGLNASEHFQQRCLATAVEPHHANTVAGLDTKGHFVQEGLQPPGFGHIFQVDQVCHDSTSLGTPTTASPQWPHHA